MTRRLTAFHLFALTAPFALSGCGLTDWADANMPVIGQRCEHWQCFTSSGQEQSELNHQERLKQETATLNGGSAPVPASAASTPAPPPAPPMPEQGAYQYVPRAPAPPGSTPFDGQIPPQ